MILFKRVAAVSGSAVQSPQKGDQGPRRALGSISSTASPEGALGWQVCGGEKPDADLGASTPNPRITAKRLLRSGIKRLLDLVIAISALALLAPGLAAVGILIRATSAGPIIFEQERIGMNRRGRRGRSGSGESERRHRDYHGRPFTIYKFRTMHIKAEATTGPVLALTDDPRVTRMGKTLRRFRIDEIPQLFNVIKGEMSLVGPRPERLFFILSDYRRIPGFEERFDVKPGITGLAQLENGYDDGIESFRRKIRYDLEYVRSSNPLKDLMILFKTVPVVMHLRHW